MRNATTATTESTDNPPTIAEFWRTAEVLFRLYARTPDKSVRKAARVEAKRARVRRLKLARARA